MADTTLPGLLASGDHASRPAANAVGSGALYSCTTHGLVYQSDGSAWSTWATLGVGALALDDLSDVDTTTTPPADGDTMVYDTASGLWKPAAGGGGGGGLTQTYVGKNAIGGSSVAPADFDTIVKKVTLANACLITDIQVYLKNNAAGQSGRVAAVLFEDVGGKPKYLRAWTGGGDASGFMLYRVSATPGDARWMSMPIGFWAPAGDWWIGFNWRGQGAQHLVYYDAGSDWKWNAGGNSFQTDAPDTSGTVYALTNSTRDYSIRANTIR